MTSQKDVGGGLTPLKDARAEQLEALILRLTDAVGPNYQLEEDLFTFDHGRKRGRSTFEQYEPSERLPKYTSSIDDARAFLPGGALWHVGSMEDGPFANVLLPNARGNYTAQRQHSCAGATPAIALVRACLKALLAEHLSRPTARAAQSPKPHRRKDE